MLYLLGALVTALVVAAACWWAAWCARRDLSVERLYRRLDQAAMHRPPAADVIADAEDILSAALARLDHPIDPYRPGEPDD